MLERCGRVRNKTKSSFEDKAAVRRPQRILQTLGQRHKALTAEHDLGMVEPREGERDESDA
jgi:hypothetical protein